MASYTATFVAGSIFAALILAWAIRQNTAALGAAEVVATRRAFAGALRQLAFFIVLGIGSAALSVFALSLRTTQRPPVASAGASPGNSGLTGIRFPMPLSTVTEKAIVETSAQQLQKLVRQVDSQSSLGRIEVLMWRDKYERARANEFIEQVKVELKKAGFLYEETNGAKNKGSSIREFVTVSRAQKKIVPGFWMITDDFLLLSWGELVPR